MILDVLTGWLGSFGDGSKGSEAEKDEVYDDLYGVASEDVNPAFGSITPIEEWPCCVVYADSEPTVEYTRVFKSEMGYSIVEFNHLSTAIKCLSDEGFTPVQSVSAIPMVWVRGERSKAAVYFVPMVMMRKLVENVLSDCFEGQTVLAYRESFD